MSLVPLPAAMIATAMRGVDRAECEDTESVRALEECVFEETLGEEDLPCDFFIRPNIPRS